MSNTMAMTESPKAILHTLVNADGSATYTAANNGCQIIAGVNYPVEVPYRSDEIPESTFIQVNLRPHNGVGMVKERHVEELIMRTLQTVVLGDETPRTMLQITLQVVSVESDESLPGGVKGGGQGETYLDVLTSALNASILGCLDAGVQMKAVAGAALVGISQDGRLIAGPSVVQRKKCTSLHVFAFTSDGKTVLMESEGKCSVGDWKQAQQVARSAVLGTVNKQHNGDVAMNGTNTSSEYSGLGVLDVIRKALEARVIKDGGQRHESQD
ncbi:hypothetical protein A1O3_10383 [Capronia epimyces CBS 606.96]|uniref:Exoribonuclease phosphorolytic domain-containing protein n=1 Tax=Capronia epimyces CBS 606.96 TaxID=1182542 RepID=W9XIP1_9EURO|nr:uncharacterized protein A1O3_10383 [Capronia epimyces CBS 606.96]EXJ77225.1 hypothetical protein A1O3_10383 [Capronia epimyces CBS 606.96]